MSNLALPVEYVASDSGHDTVTKEPVVILTCRLNPGSFSISNLVFSKEHAERLHRQLTQILESGNLT